MTTRAAAATCRKSIPAAVAILALSATLIGCADPVALQYAYDAHAKEVGAWCYAHDGARKAPLHEECIHRAWASIPPSRYWIRHHSKVGPCLCGTDSVAALTSEMSAAPDATVKPSQ